MSNEPIDRAAFIKRVFALFLPFVIRPPAQEKTIDALPLLADGQPLNATWLDSIVTRVNELSRGQK